MKTEITEKKDIKGLSQTEWPIRVRIGEAEGVKGVEEDG